MGLISRFTERAKKWKFTIYNTVDSWEIDEPIGWEDIRLILTRNTTYKTLFRGFSADLQYLGDAYDTLVGLDEETGSQTEAYLKVEKANTQDGSYTEVLDSKLDFTEWAETSENRRGVNIPLVDSSFNEKIAARKTIDIPVDKTTDLDENEIDAIEYQTISFKGREFGGSGEGELYETPVSDEDTVNEYTSQGTSVLRVTFPDVDLLPNFNNTVKQLGKGISTTIITDCIYYTSNVTAKIDGIINVHISGSNTNNSVFAYKAKFNSDGEYDSTTGVLFDESFFGSINKAISFEAELDEMEGILLMISTPGTGVTPTLIIQEDTSIELNYYSSYAATPCKVVMPFEAIQYLITAITGETDNLTSNYFGRTDLGYDEDGEGSLVALTNGKLIRQFPTGYIIDEDDEEDEDADTVAALSFNLDEFFSNHYKKDNVGMQITQVDGKYQVVVEKQSDIFSYDIVHEVDFIEKGSFNRTRDLDHIYSAVSAGYIAAAEDLVGGLEEYISAIYHSTALSYVDNTLDLISTYSAVTSRLEKQRRKPFASTSTEELIGDTQIFFIELWRDEETDEFVQRETQGFAEVIGLDNLETKLNLGITPKTIFGRHGSEVNTGLYKDPTSIVTFNTADKLTDLKLKKEGSDTYIVENQSETSGSLDNPLWSGYNIDFTSALGLTDYFNIQDNPNGIIQFTSPLSGSVNFGWALEIGTGAVDKENNMSLREAYPEDIGIIKVLGVDDETALATENDELIEANN